jgi:hypothetical protein
MATAPKNGHGTSQAAIFGRVWDGLTPVLARHVLQLGFSGRDRDRMHELAVKNQAGTLGPEELAELDNYIQAGDLLAIVQARAGKILKQAAAKRHG